MSQISNTELAQKLSDVADGWQSFVTQQLDWLTTTVEEVTLEDPVTGNQLTLKSLYGLEKTVTDLTEGAGGAIDDAFDLLAQSEQHLAEAQDAQALFDGYNATFINLRDESEVARDKAQDWAEAEEDIEVEPDAYSAKHHATKAVASSDSAAVSESNAADSEAAAATSETNAAQSETNAAASETAAAQSESNAAASETAAAQSETNAASSETNAASSETAAASSESKAADWAEADEDIEVELGAYSAKHHATKAGASADSAALSETNAAQSATDAQDAATGLENAEQNASDSADAAAASETAAATSETNAASSETNAAQSETDAATHKDKSYAWAETAEDVEVEPGEYSAKHWAKKALENTEGISNTDDLPEGINNLYFTDIRAVDAIKADAAWNAGKWTDAYEWGNHALEGYLKTVGWLDITGKPSVFPPESHGHGFSEISGTLSDNQVAESNVTQHQGALTITESQISDLNHYTDTDAVNAIKADDDWRAANWDAAYSWGNHALEGYLKSVGWTDVTGKPSVFPPESHSHGYADLPISSANVNNWNTAYSLRATGLSWSEASKTLTVNRGGATDLNVSLIHAHESLSTGYGLNGSDYDGGANRTFSLTSISAGSGSHGALRYNGTNRSAGRLYGGSSNPVNTTRLNYDGRLYTTDTYATSDRNMKKDIESLSPYLCKLIVSDLNPVSFRWKESEREDHGLIAQEVEKVAPYFAPDGKSVNYPKLVTYLIGAIQHLNEELEELQEKVNNGCTE